MSEQLNRYENNPKIVSHLASGYVLGLLPLLVRNRVEKIIASLPNGTLNKEIRAFENKLSPLDQHTAEMEPLSSTWENIENAITADNSSTESVPTGFKWLDLLDGLISNRIVSAMGLVVAVVLMVNTFTKQSDTQQLSYIAVMSSAEQPQLIAATYGHNKELALDVLSLPDLSEQQDMELWVVSKTDKLARSLGVINTQIGTHKRILSEAEWRLIKDSASLLLTLEDKGGSPFGEPSDEIVSQGLCIQMPSWKEEV